MTDATIKTAANKVAQTLEADVILLNAEMERGKETKIIDKCGKAKRRPNALLIIVTEGGDADVAYRIARCLQSRYKKVTALISGFCKSAGTLLAVGAHELVFSPHGELGPLDVQLRKTDDLWAASSGLTVTQAFVSLQQKAHEMFEEFALRIKARSGGQVTFKTAADISTKLTTGLLSNIYQQIEVMHVGEAARAMNVAKDYGRRLNRVARNLKDDSLDSLLAAYPSHGFVIDATEARELFVKVRETTPEEQELCDALGDAAKFPAATPEPLYYLSDPPKNPSEAANDENQQNRTDPATEKPGADAVAGGAAEAPHASETIPDSAEVIPLAGGSSRT